MSSFKGMIFLNLLFIILSFSFSSALEVTELKEPVSSSPKGEEIDVEKEDPKITTSLKDDDSQLLEPESLKVLDSIETHLEHLFDVEKENQNKAPETLKTKTSIFNEFAPPTLEDIHTALSTDIVGLSESVDTFFVNDRIIDGRNTTHLRIIGSLSMIERTGFVDNLDLRLRFRLPRLEKKIQFEVNNLDNSLTTDTTLNTTPNTSPRNQQQNTTAGFSFFKDVLGLHSKFTLGFIFRDFAPFGNFRLSKALLLSENDNIMMISDVFGDTEDRTGQRTTIYYDHAFHKQLLFRFFNESQYRNEFHSFETQHGFSLYQTLNDRHSIAYTAQARSENLKGQSTFYLRSYDILSTYRYRAYKKHMFVDLIPAVSFPKEYQFLTNWSLTLRLEIIFGSL